MQVEQFLHSIMEKMHSTCQGNLKLMCDLALQVVSSCVADGSFHDRSPQACSYISEHAMENILSRFDRLSNYCQFVLKVASVFSVQGTIQCCVYDASILFYFFPCKYGVN